MPRWRVAAHRGLIAAALLFAAACGEEPECVPYCVPGGVISCWPPEPETPNPCFTSEYRELYAACLSDPHRLRAICRLEGDRPTPRCFTRDGELIEDDTPTCDHDLTLDPFGPPRE